MSAREDGGYAFPSKFTVAPGSNKPDGTIAGANEQFNYVELGMTLRDHFAGLALQAFMRDGAYDYSSAAQHAYMVADAMLAARMTNDELSRKVSK